MNRLMLALSLCVVSFAGGAEDYAAQRADMIKAIENDVRDTRGYLGKQDLNEQVWRALSSVPRHEFVPAAQRVNAYENRPLPIGFGQTISQPYIVAIMTDLLDLEPDDIVFELGTGSGYQAAVLAELAQHVYTMEIVTELAARASKTLTDTGFRNVTVQVGDGYFGWLNQAPFDAIVVTAAGDHIPPPLVQQLKAGGRMVIPVGSRFLVQQLMLVEKQPNGAILTREILPVRFVPLVGSH